MSTGLYPIIIILGITVGGAASTSIQTNYAKDTSTGRIVSQAVGAGCALAAIAHIGLLGSKGIMPQSQKFLIQAPLIGTAVGLYFAPRFRIRNVTVWDDEEED